MVTKQCWNLLAWGTSVVASAQHPLSLFMFTPPTFWLLHRAQRALLVGGRHQIRDGNGAGRGRESAPHPWPDPRNLFRASTPKRLTGSISFTSPSGNRSSRGTQADQFFSTNIMIYIHKQGIVTCASSNRVKEIRVKIGELEICIFIWGHSETIYWILPSYIARGEGLLPNSGPHREFPSPSYYNLGPRPIIPVGEFYPHPRPIGVGPRGDPSHGENFHPYTKSFALAPLLDQVVFDTAIPLTLPVAVDGASPLPCLTVTVNDCPPPLPRRLVVISSLCNMMHLMEGFTFLS